MTILAFLEFTRKFQVVTTDSKCDLFDRFVRNSALYTSNFKMEKLCHRNGKRRAVFETLGTCHNTEKFYCNVNVPLLSTPLL